MIIFTKYLFPAQGIFNCNFDTNFCGWTQDISEQFDWLRNKGSTPTVGTGPTVDHTSSSQSFESFWLIFMSILPFNIMNIFIVLSRFNNNRICREYFPVWG